MSHREETFFQAGSAPSRVDGSGPATTGEAEFLTYQLVLLDEAAKLPTRNQLAPLPHHQLRREEYVAMRTPGPDLMQTTKHWKNSIY